MTTYYIDPSLTSTGNGSFETPFSSWTSVTWTAGNTYLQKEGTTYVGEVTISNPGTATARIYVGTYSQVDGSIVTARNRQAIIQGSGSNGYAVGMNPAGSRSYIDVNNLRMIAGETGAQNYGFYAYNSLLAQETNVRNCTLQNCTISSPWKTGVAISGRGWTIANNVIFNCAIDGIFTRAMDYTIEDNIIYDCDTNNALGDAIQHSNLGHCGVSVIRNNKITHPLGGVKQAIIIDDDTTGGFMHIYGNTIAGGGGSCISSSVNPSVIERNLIDGLMGTNGVSFLSSGVIVRNNLFKNCTSSLIFTVDNCTGVQIYNNTFIRSTERVISQTTGITGNEYIFKNNIIQDCGDNSTRTFALQTGNTFTHDYNSYSGSLAPFSIAGTLYDTFADYVTGETQDVNSLTVDPVLDVYYRVKSTSPLIEAGTVVASTRDMDGALRNNPPTIGAYEGPFSRGTR